MMIFVLSAISPEAMPCALRQVAATLRPGGQVLFRWEGRAGWLGGWWVGRSRCSLQPSSQASSAKVFCEPHQHQRPLTHSHMPPPPTVVHCLPSPPHRDYAAGDLAQDRLAAEGRQQLLGASFYVRWDGTRAFYFSEVSPCCWHCWYCWYWCYCLAPTLRLSGDLLLVSHLQRVPLPPFSLLLLLPSSVACITSSLPSFPPATSPLLLAVQPSAAAVCLRCCCCCRQACGSCLRQRASLVRESA